MNTNNEKYYSFDVNNNIVWKEPFWHLDNEKGQEILLEALDEYSARNRLGVKNVSASDVVMSRNADRSLIKKNVSVRVPQDLVHAYMKFAGSLNVPVSDLFAYVLKYGFLCLREIKEI